MKLSTIPIEHFLRLGFQALNNETEYEALLTRLRAMHKPEAFDLEIYSDSQLVVSQVEANFKAKDT